MNVIVEPAQKSDMTSIQTFTRRVGVELDQASIDDVQYMMMKTKAGQMIGVLGIDIVDPSAILRALVIDSSFCKSDDLFYLLHVAIGYARGRQADAVYFVSAASPDLFQPLGFKEVDIEALPDSVRTRPPFNDDERLEKVSILMCPCGE